METWKHENKEKWREENMKNGNLENEKPHFERGADVMTSSPEN